MRAIFLLFAILTSINAIAQSTYLKKSKVAYIYQLTNEQAKDLIKQDYKNYHWYSRSKALTLPNSFYEQPIDTIDLQQNLNFKTSTIEFRSNYPIGHYLAVFTKGEFVEHRYFSNYDIGIVPLMLEQKFQFHIVDSSGNYIEADKVTANKKRLSYQKDKGIYNIGNFYTDRLLTIEYNGHQYFFEIANDDYFYDTWIVRKWERLVDSDLFYEPWEEIKRFSKRTYNYKIRPFWASYTYGYVTTNKPKYQPNDTVKVKAYLVRDNNVPHNSPLTLKITTWKGTKIETTVQPNSKGNYSYELPLGDSLELDRNYIIGFWKGKRYLMETSFKYEDYQLDEINFDLELEKETYQRHEPIIFYASAKNATGQNVLDGQLEILIQPKIIDDYFAPKVLIADTLFYYKGAFIPNDLTGDKMRFVIPKERLSLADVTFSLNANFSNANGEFHEQKSTFDLKGNPKSIDMRYEGDTLRIDYLVNEKSVATQGKLEMTIPNSNYVIEKTIQLPYQTIGQTIFETITVKVENETKTLNLSRKQSIFTEPTFKLVQTSDSVFVFGNNPNGIKVNYQIYRVNKKITQNESTEKMILWKDKIRKKTSYRIDYEYVIGKEGKVKSQRFNYATNQLKVTIDQPEIIQPGETVDVKIKVQNVKNHNAKNVNLAAGAVNTQFKDLETWRYSKPFYGDYSNYRKDIKSSYDNFKYDISTYRIFDWSDGRFSLYDTIPTTLQKILLLDNELYYQFLFTDSYLEQTMPIQSDTVIAQFAPLLVKNRKFVPIYLIYANKKLVYYHDAETPYSFKGQAGYNEIIIRGKDFEITIDSVFLQKGEKLNFSINLNNLPKNVTLTKQPTTWTSAEKRILRNSIFSFQRTNRETNQLYVWQDDVIYPFKIEETVTHFGPFEANKPIHFIKKNEFYTTFDFKPQYNYELDKNQQRLYMNEFMSSFDDIELSNIGSRSNIEDTLFLSRKIMVFDKDDSNKSRPWKVKMLLSEVTFEKGKNIRYHFRSKQVEDSSYVHFIFVNQSTNEKYFYKSHNKRSQLPPTQFTNLQAGNYQMYGYTDWGNYFTKTVEIFDNKIVCEYLENIDFQLDTNFVLLHKILNLELQYDQSFNENYQGETYTIQGKVMNANGENIISALVQLKGTNIKTTTDLDGKYSINIPKEIAIPILTITYIGLQTEEIDLRNTKENYNIVMIAKNSVEEVTVIGYNVHKKSHLTGAVMRTSGNDNTEETLLLEKQLQGKVAGLNGNQNSGNIRIRGMSSYKSFQILKDNRSTAIYGSRALSDDFYIIDGVIITDPKMIEALKRNSKIRSEFRDYAFWQPNLKTDKNGEAIFRVTYPDDVTSYQTFVLGMDKKLNFGMATKTVKSQKVVLAQLAVPRFLIEGDKVNVIGKSLNYSTDSLRIKSTFLSENNILESNEFWLNELKIEMAEVIAEADKNELELTYKMEHAKFFDGEKRNIPIYKKGVKETVGIFHILENDTTLSLNFDPSKGNVKLYAQTDVLEVLLDDIQYLIDYPYGCNEQTASRLLALLMNDKIQQLTDVNYQNSKAEKANRQAILKMVKRLEKAQNDDDSWGWWSGNSTNYWMTNHVLKALNAADTSGYKSESYESGLRFMINSLDQKNPYQLLNTIEILSEIKLNMDYEMYLEKIDTNLRYNDYYNQLRILKIKQEQGLDYDLLVLDSLENQTTFGNIFFDSNTYYNWYSNRQNLTQLAYAIIKNENPNDKRLSEIRGYFLEKRSRNGWRNTFTTAQILATILPDISNSQNREQPKLVLKGNTTETITKFPYEMTFYSNQTLEIKKTGNSTIYFTAYQQFWNEKPKTKNDIFELKSRLYQEGKAVKKLEFKTATKMVVTLEVKKEAEYVMVEVPIPAGCSYGEKSRGYGYWYGREVHREYFREKTCVFYQNLPVGTYTIEINLEPRFTGEYTVNPAKAEQMYFPIFYGRNAIKEVKIEEK